MAYRYRMDNYYIKPKFYGETRLFQIGMLYCNEDSVIDTHRHGELFELTVVTSGKGTAYTNDKSVEISARDIHIAYPREVHKIVTDKDEPLQFEFFAFMSDNDKYREELYRIMEDNQSAADRIFHDESISGLIREGIREVESGARYSDKVMGAICERIIIGVLRAFEQREDIEKRAYATDADHICYQAMTYIDEHLFSIKSLTEVAGALNYNYSYLSNLFKKNTGEGLMDYYRKRRLEAASRLLMEKGRTVTGIAEMLNYSSAYAFSRAFKAEYGVSPNQYLLSLKRK